MTYYVLILCPVGG